MEAHILDLICKGIANENKTPRIWLSLYSVPNIPHDDYTRKNYREQITDYQEIRRDKLQALK